MNKKTIQKQEDRQITELSEENLDNVVGGTTEPIVKKKEMTPVQESSDDRF